MNAWIRSASPTAIATVSTSSTTDFTADLGAFVVERAIEIRCLEETEPAGWPIGQKCTADDPLPRDRAPVPAVLGIRTIVPHHVVIAGGDGDRGRHVARAT